jgi:pimeloyl-ACP methyl ester carboxylesterase
VRFEGFRPHLDAVALQDLRQRLARSRVPSTDTDGWERGVPERWLAQLIADWQAFDTGAFQSLLDEFSHMRAHVGGLEVHVLYQAGAGPSPLPVMLTHGWPGSFCEFLRLIPLLSDPASHGGDAADAFTVVVPSLPGFGFSGPPPPGGLTARAVADVWNQIMVDGFGYHQYVAHGSDLGAGVTARLARQHPETVVGIHLATPGLAPPPKPWSESEARFFGEVEAWTAEEGGYAHEHATKPFTLGAALHDSPAGLGAWIGEKVRAWSSLGTDGEPAFARDLLLATLTLYWATGTIASSLLPYWAFRHAPSDSLPAGDPAVTPTAVSIFGGERVPFPKPPRELAERYFSVTSWAEHERGGHFPAVSEPQLLAVTLRDAFRPFRASTQRAELQVLS